MLGNINDSVINIHITEIKTLDIISNKVFQYEDTGRIEKNSICDGR